MKKGLVLEGGAMRGMYTAGVLDVLKEQVREGKALIIQPAAPLAVSRTEKNPDKLKAIYELGRKDATEKLAKIQEFLA